MYYIYWILIPVMVMFAIIYGVIWYRLHVVRLALKEEEKLLAGQAELLQKEQKEMNDFKAQLAEQIYVWKNTRQERSETIQIMQNELFEDMEEREDGRCWQDAFLNLTFLHKMDECWAQDIEVTLEGFPQEGMPAPKERHMELSGLIINLFDNAREACMLIPEEEERWIRIGVRRDANRLYFSMENSCNERSRQQFGTNTWKKNSDEHGVGLDIVNDLVSDMRGRIKSERRDNVYYVELMLPLGRAA